MRTTASTTTATATLREAIQEIGLALNRPEQFALRWKKRREAPTFAPSPAVFTVLLVNAVLGLAGFGLTMKMHLGLQPMLQGALKAPTACGLAWVISLPSLYILNSLNGSKLDASTTVLAALTTCSFGAMAMLAGVPVAWFFAMTLPFPAVRLAVNVVIFAGVGICMADVFLRTMKALEPRRSLLLPASWLALLGLIGLELQLLFNLFDL